LLGFADVDLIKRLKGKIGPLVMTKENGFQIDMKDFGRTAVGDVGANDVDLGDSGTGGEAPNTLEHLTHFLRPFIGNSPLEPVDLADQVKLLTPVLGDPDVDRSRRRAGPLGNNSDNLWNGPALNPRSAQFAQVNPSVRGHGPESAQVRLTIDRDRQDVGAADLVVIDKVVAPGGWDFIGH
jgi:hypothetical protein